MDSQPRRALVSVSNKSGLVPFVQQLVAMDFAIVSTGGTRKHLEEADIPVIDISTYTGFPEIMDGRVKTLHPKVHGAILGRTDLEKDITAIKEHGIVPFQVVVCNLYPFEETVAREGVTVPEAIEQIDIGGPSMIRSAAKNHAYVGVVTKPKQYDSVVAALKSDSFDQPFRQQLAAAAFTMTARYDAAISQYMNSLPTVSGETSGGSSVGAELSLQFRKQSDLRYGENPHQTASFYVEPNPDPTTLAASKKLHGKELSYNNLLDLDSALAIVREFSEPAAVVIKHTNPCGCATADNLEDAFKRAYAGDPVSAFGSILGFNRLVDAITAERLCEPDRFIEAIIAPGFDEAAMTALTTIPKWKKNVRLLQCPALNETGAAQLEYRRVSGGLLVQDRDDQPDPEDEWKCVTDREPSTDEWNDLRFSWRVCKHVKSNAIVFAARQSIVGVGAGQMSRVDSATIAAEKAGVRSQGAVVASDAFFPFRDGLDQVAQAGITAVIQPGGSRGDEEVIAACNEHNVAMIFTGRRHFKH